MNFQIHSMLPYSVSFFLASGFLALLAFVLFLNVFGLPANWIILGLAFCWDFFLPEGEGLGLIYWICMLVLALAGEGIELGLQILKAKTYGSSSSGTFMGVIGAFVGAIILAPLFWGIGAFIGALIGAWLGCLIMELMKGRPGHEAFHSACGAMVGRFLGTTCKIGIGAAMIVFTAQYIMPEEPLMPPDAINQDIAVISHPWLRICPSF